MKDAYEKVPAVMIERPKMPRATWEALRAHILRERQRKKQEQEQSQEFERQKKEREHKKKQEALTLEETKEQIAHLEAQLTLHKEEKHQLFHTLKKVLYEDETRRRSKEVPQPHLYLQPSSRPGGSGHGPGATAYIMKSSTNIMAPSATRPTPVTSNSSPSVPMKRPKSPSPVHGPASYYRPPSGSGTSLQGVPASKYVAYTTTGSANQLPPSAFAPVTVTNVTPVRPAPSLPSHYQSFPGPAVSSVHHSRLAEEERAKLYLSSAATANYLTSAAQAAATANYLTSANAVAQQAAVVRQAAAFAQLHQRAAVAAALAGAQQPPPVAHGSVTGGFRPGSIMTGFPRYPVSTGSSLTITSGPPPPRMAHSGQNGGQPQRYYRE